MYLDHSYVKVCIFNMCVSGGSRISRRGGGVDSRGGYVSKILYVKTKESWPLGWGEGVRRARPPLDPPMCVYRSQLLSATPHYV